MKLSRKAPSVSLLETRAQLRKDLEGRNQRSVTPRLIDVDHIAVPYDDEAIASVVPPRSSIVVYYAPASKGVIDDLAAALSASNEVRLRAIGKEVQRKFDAQDEFSEQQALTRLRASACVFDVRYRGKTVAENFGLIRGLRFATITLTYVGRATTEADFQIVEYRKTAKDPGYEYLIARHAPVLTALENAVLEKIPHELLEVTVGLPRASDCAQQVADVVRRAAEQAVREKHQRTGGCPRILNSIKFKTLDRMLREGTISPTATAQALMRAREELFFRSLD